MLQLESGNRFVCGGSSIPQKHSTLKGTPYICIVREYCYDTVTKLASILSSSRTLTSILYRRMEILIEDTCWRNAPAYCSL